MGLRRRHGGLHFSRSLSFRAITWLRAPFAIARNVLAMAFHKHPLRGYLRHYLWSYVICNKLLHRRRGEPLTVSIKGKPFLFPNTASGVGELRSIFIDEVFARLKGPGRILDLGGFLGETAVYFLVNGATDVHAYEPLPSAFSYLKRNLRPYKAKAFPFAVGPAAGTQTLRVDATSSFDLGASLREADETKQHTTRIRTVSIASVLQRTKFDALKMNIEGAEFAILDHLMAHPGLWRFSRGHIGFHFYGKHAQHWRTYRRFRTFLSERGYRVLMLRLDDSIVPETAVTNAYRDLPAQTYLLFNIYFER